MFKSKISMFLTILIVLFTCTYAYGVTYYSGIPFSNSASDGDIATWTNSGKWKWVGGATFRTSIGLGTTDSPQFTGIELGHATENTLSASGGTLSIEGVALATDAAKQATLTNEAGLYGALSDVSDFAQPSEVNLSITGDWDFVLFRGTPAEGAIGAIEQADEFWTDGTYDPASTSSANPYKALKISSTNYVGLYDDEGNAFFKTFTTTETEFIPFGYTDITDGGADPDSSLHSTNSNSREYKVVTFDAATDEDRSFVFDVAEDLTGSTIKVRWIGIVTAATGPSDEDISFQVSCISVADGETADFAAYGDVVAITEAGVTEARDDLIVSAYGTITPTGLAGGETVHCLINRDADSADEYAQDFGLIGVRIKYQRTHDTTF